MSTVGIGLEGGERQAEGEASGGDELVGGLAAGLGGGQVDGDADHFIGVNNMVGGLAPIHPIKGKWAWGGHVVIIPGFGRLSPNAAFIVRFGELFINDGGLSSG